MLPRPTWVLLPRGSRGRRPLRLRFGAQLGLFVLLGVAVLLASAGLLLHGFGGALHLGRLRASEQLDVVKISLSVVAGVGGVIALTVAYRKQQLGEAAHGREEVKLFTERFGACVTQLGDDSPAVRLGGVYALAHLADDWETGRQTCIDVLCAQLRMPYPADQPDDPETHAAFLSLREVRHTIWRLIGDHIRPGKTQHSWSGYDFNFTGAVIDGANLQDVVFPSGEVSFHKARFTDGEANFTGASFAGAEVDFSGAQFFGAKVNFSTALFSGGTVDFTQATFSAGEVTFFQAQFQGTDVVFSDSQFIASTVDFVYTEIIGGRISFSDIRFSGKELNFSGSHFIGGTVDFPQARFTGGELNFFEAKFKGTRLRFLFTEFRRGVVLLLKAEFLDGTITFQGAKFLGAEVNFYQSSFTGSNVDFRAAEFEGGMVDISSPHICRVAPIFDKLAPSFKYLRLPNS
jgi:uncharacterized protein YjbI with pentapeptide repeats